LKNVQIGIGKFIFDKVSIVEKIFIKQRWGLGETWAQRPPPRGGVVIPWMKWVTLIQISIFEAFFEHSRWSKTQIKNTRVPPQHTRRKIK
jgi:hypothetical protein